MSALSLEIKSGPAPAPRPRADRKGDMRKQFDAMERGQWVEIEVGSLAEFDTIRRRAERAGCRAYWSSENKAVVAKGGRRK